MKRFRISLVLVTALMTWGCTPELANNDGQSQARDTGYDSGESDLDAEQTDSEHLDTSRDTDDGDTESPDSELPDSELPDSGDLDAEVPDSGPDIEEHEPEPEWFCSGFDCAASQGTSTPGSMTALDGCNIELALQAPLSEGQALADSLIERLEEEESGIPVPLTTVVNNLNRDGRSGLSSDATARMSGLDAVGFRWNTGDENVDYWYPQGITGTSDHSDVLTYDGKRLLIVSWYNKTDDQPSRGARITIADITDLDDVSYRHLLLVEPFDGADGPDFGPAEYDSGVAALHVGGIAWYGPYLYVADTVQGLRVYDMERIFRPSNFDDTSRIGVSSGRADAHGYLYAVPRIGRFRLTSESCRVRFSFVGMNPVSDPPVLITGEYINPEDTGRLVTWPLDPTTHELETRQGTTRAQQAVVIGQNRAQGALVIDDHFYVSASSQDGSYGRLYKGQPGEANQSINWVRGAEDLYWEQSHGLIWTPAEHPGTRDVVGVPTF